MSNATRRKVEDVEVTMTVRVPQSTVDALDAAANERMRLVPGQKTQRSDMIRIAIAFFLDHEAKVKRETRK